MNSASQQLTNKKILLFWMPLALTWLMMSVEGPLLAALIARLPEAVFNLAAYGVAYAFALIAEAPVIMLLSASTALCKGAESYRRLRRFTLVLSLGVTALLILIALPPVFDLIGIRLLGLPADVAEPTRLAIWFLLPWPGAIGLRRFYQGVLIVDGRTRRVTAGTLVRMCGMALTGLAAAGSGLLPGAAAGSLALSCGVVAEVLITRRLARPSIKTLLQKDDAEQAPSMAEIWHFYLPLALTPFIALSIQPIIIFFLGRGVDSLESLAVLPVLYGLTFIFRALGLSYQEVAIVLLGDRLENRRMVGRFALCLALVVGTCLGLIAMTPLAVLWLRDVAGLTVELVSFSRLPLMLMVPMPMLTVWITWQRSLLMTTKKTGPVSVATSIEAAAICLFLAVLIPMTSLPGILLAAIALVTGRLLAIIYLAPHCRRIILSGEKDDDCIR
ncbi:MAG: hypothetical protein KAT93_06570 [Desulfuromonadales bacterium]|nr:hypothetical protein [Desulfuromonadales bacterium]